MKREMLLDEANCMVAASIYVMGRGLWEVAPDHILGTGSLVFVRENVYKIRE
jgi:hypothetical protein